MNNCKIEFAGRLPSAVLPAPMLELFPTAARTGVVAPDFWAGADRFRLFGGRHCFRNHFAALVGRRGLAAAGCAAKCGGLLVDRFLRQLPQELLERQQARGAAEDVVTNLGL